MIADLAYLLNTPIGTFLDMPWDELARWYAEAIRIVRLKEQHGRPFF